MIDPRFHTVLEWTDFTGAELESFGTVMRLDTPENWRDWAAHAISLGGLQAKNAPNPYQFDDWREWAERFNQVVQIEG